ncbi:ligase-associated DNA damage response endonuclease PdeM [Meridianimarinicoccus roseus]|uniref:Ligase-associated DNA damage response endonuclease PdeM n=1 Tax=Meridianimarinicoccus roseus TaxID=2072018 RepID=A0A2V2LKB3_9RHOB|nr:ligase-associated DNA damage response endonuclease PdeM [Meridianimarinicoccus roseus]PWR03964.1 ligase-associated DNA damage response endonuclease PdeM [Meridianimarinicoccus roseus]
MNDYTFTLGGAELHARPSGALWWPSKGLLCVSDLHFGKAARIARRSGGMLPPYEGQDTLDRLEAELDATGARHVICLGDSFDDMQAAGSLPEDLGAWLLRLIAGRDWAWVEGNHDPGPIDLPGTHRAEIALGPLVFRHIAQPGAEGEVSGHYHPKARLGFRGGAVARPCFLIDGRRVVLPAFGTYTGGLCSTSPVLCALMDDDARAVMTGSAAHAIPMPRVLRRRA